MLTPTPIRIRPRASSFSAIACPTAVAEGQRVRATGVVSEFNGMTEITASTAGSVVVTNAGNNLAQVTPTVITLPIAGDINAFSKLVKACASRSNTLTVSGIFSSPLRHHRAVSGRASDAIHETSAPSVAGNAAYLASLDARRVVLDDDNDVEQTYHWACPMAASSFITRAPTAASRWARRVPTSSVVETSSTA